MDTFRILEIEPYPTDRQWDYMLLKVFHHTNDFKRINYKAIFDVFETEGK